MGNGQVRKMRIPDRIGLAAVGLLAILSVGCTASRGPDAGVGVAGVGVTGAMPAQVSVCFVPAQQCDTVIIAAIGAARQSIRVQAYGFTAQPILRALAEAKARGVDVEAILDKSNDPPERSTRRPAAEARARQTGAQFTAAARIPTWIDYSVAIAHNKVIVIDARLVIGGSYNYTTSAEHRNAENVTFIESADIARLYLANWDARRAAARLYIPASGAEVGAADAPAPVAAYSARR